MNLKIDRLTYSEPLIILTMWAAIFAAPLFMFSKEELLYWDNVIRSLRAIIPFFLLFLFNHFVLIPLFLFKKRKVPYLIAAILTILVFSLILFYMEAGGFNNQLPPPHPGQGMQFGPGPGPGAHPPPQHRPNPFPYPPLVNTIIMSILILGFGAGIRMIVRWSVLEQEKTKLERENVQNQLAFLKNQVSPHFFMNTLNNIHALIDIDSEEAKTSIISLSKLMRHILYESEVDRIPLKKELEFLSNYISLMKLRFSEKVKVELTMPSTIPEKKIPPLLFISFLENAFKHGISYNADSFINIDIKVDNDKLMFSIINSNHKKDSPEKESGIGIANSRKRLDLLFHDNYTLNIEDDNTIHKLYLTIPL